MEFAAYIIPGLMALGGIIVLMIVKTILKLRRVVSTNEVHIVQSSKKTSSYGKTSSDGKDAGNGNVYYEWPSWVPMFGVTKSVLPLSVFDLDLNDYNAYDRDRVPFKVHIKAFFRITDSNKAAERVSNFAELKEQLLGVVQGAVRAILASHDIEEIMQGRSKFAEVFTKEVHDQVTNWGIDTVKNLELMDIRDTDNSVVIQNIMAKKKSHIDMESRTEVAKNKQAAEIAEINAQQAVDLQAQQAKQAVGLRTIEAERQVELQKQEKIQVVKEQEKLTKEKEMAIKQVEQQRAAEIEKDVQLVKAQQNRETTVVIAQGQKETTVLAAEAQLEAETRQAEAIKLKGAAKAEAEKSMQLAPVEAQIVLAKEIGENQSYQQYLVTIEQIKAQQVIGVEQAKALSAADVKVIANTGSGPSDSLKGVMDLFSAKGGTQVGAALEGLSQTDAGLAVLRALGLSTDVIPAKNGAPKA